jgi:peptide deformylase
MTVPRLQMPTAPTMTGPLYAAGKPQGFGRAAQKKGKKSKAGRRTPESFLTPREPEVRPEERNLPIEKLPTTIFDDFGTAGQLQKDEIDPGLVDGLEIIKYPNPILRAENELITEEQILSGEVQQIARQMFEMMYQSNGIGLAAPQVGINKRMMVYNPTGERDNKELEQVLINPVIVSFSKRIIDAPEGCLSFPTKPLLPFQKPDPFQGTVYRPDAVVVRAINLKGQTQEHTFKGWAARIFQHEYDHLDGILWIDRLVAEERQRLDKEITTLINDYKFADAALEPRTDVKVWPKPERPPIELVP